MVSMANSGSNKNSSQFFFTYAEQVKETHVFFRHLIRTVRYLNLLLFYYLHHVLEFNREISLVSIVCATQYSTALLEWGPKFI